MRPPRGAPVYEDMQLRESAVDFPTLTRAHVALASADLNRSLSFYRALFGTEPTKLREGYAKFELHEPPLNLTLNAVAEAPAAQADPAHFGIQVKSTAAVLDARETMRVAGFGSRSEEAVGCCFATQDKVWFADPDGNRWEVFVVTRADLPEHSTPAEAVSEQPADDPAVAARSCCEPSCCA